MNDALERIAWKACTSALQLDRWATGELSPPEAAAVRGHVAACPRCSAAADALRAATQVELPPLRVAPSPRAPRRHLPAALGGFAAALAASLLLVLRLPPPAPAGTGLKGSGLGLAVYARHGSEVRRLEPGDAVSAGDALRFAVSAPVQGYVAVLSLDPLGKASVYFPLGPRAAPLDPGGAPLPLGTRLDESVGVERIWALVCAAPVELEPLRAELERREDVPALEGCQVIRWHLVKR